MVSNLVKAIELNLFEELDALPTEFEKFEHSEKYLKKINRLFDRMRGDKLHRFTKRTTTIILVAAIILALLIVGFAATFGREFVINSFSDHFEYSVTDKKSIKSVTSLTVDYVPDGFVLAKESSDNKTIFKKVFEKNDKYFTVIKRPITDLVNYDTDTQDFNVEIDGITYVFFGDVTYDLSGYIWNKNDYVYYVQGNIPKESLLEIAKHVN